MKPCVFFHVYMVHSFQMTFNLNRVSNSDLNMENIIKRKSKMIHYTIAGIFQMIEVMERAGVF